MLGIQFCEHAHSHLLETVCVHNDAMSFRFDREFEPRVFYAKRQCKRSYPSSGESSCSEDGVNYQCQPKKKDASSDEESITDETMYRKKYYFIKKVAKSLVFVS